MKQTFRVGWFYGNTWRFCADGVSQKDAEKNLEKKLKAENKSRFEFDRYQYTCTKIEGAK